MIINFCQITLRVLANFSRTKNKYYSTRSQNKYKKGRKIFKKGVKYSDYDQIKSKYKSGGGRLFLVLG